jgi:hypothetical protein
VTSAAPDSGDQVTSARFFDTRAAYMMFVTATDEKAVVADRLGKEAASLDVRQPGLRVLDAGMGDASVLNHLMRRLHHVLPHIPWLIVAKEISIEDVRQALARLPDRLIEHPETVLVVTNMRFSETPALQPSDPKARLVWRNVPLEGSTSHDFIDQIRRLYPILAEDWAVETSPVTGNPLYRTPAVVVLYRRDREFLLRNLIPRPGEPPDGYDLVIASQTYRARTPVNKKVANVLVPLARSLVPGGKLVGIHSHGDDPGLEIIRGVWPDEGPFPHSRQEIVDEARRVLSSPEDSDLEFPPLTDEESLFTYRLHAMPSQEIEHIGTSSLVAAFTAAAYVAQIDEPRLSAAMASGDYLAATREVVERHGGVWFNDETFLITRRNH